MPLCLREINGCISNLENTRGAEEARRGVLRIENDFPPRRTDGVVLLGREDMLPSDLWKRGIPRFLGFRYRSQGFHAEMFQPYNVFKYLDPKWPSSPRSFLGTVKKIEYTPFPRSGGGTGSMA